MSMQTSSARFLVYLLHFDKPVRGKRHYCGICRGHRLAIRLRTHQIGRGANLTRQAVREATGWHLAMLIPTDAPELEKTIKRHGHLKDRCVVCRKGDTDPCLFANVHHFDPLPAPPRSSVASWP